MRHFSPELNAGSIKDEKAASFFLTQIRPEGHVFLLEVDAVHVKTCQLFSDYVSKHNAAVLQWEVAAFWWASVASLIPLNVADLTTGINNWQERYLDAISYWHTMYDREPGKTIPKAPKNEEEAEIYWGLWEDLKHSGSLSLDHSTPAVGEWLTHIVYRVAKSGSYCLPSRFLNG